MISAQVLPDGLVCLDPYVWVRDPYGWVHLSGIGLAEINLQHFLGHGVFPHPPPHRAVSAVYSTGGP